MGSMRPRDIIKQPWVLKTDTRQTAYPLRCSFPVVLEVPCQTASRDFGGQAHLVIHARDLQNIAAQDAQTLCLEVDLNGGVGYVHSHALPILDLRHCQPVLAQAPAGIAQPSRAGHIEDPLTSCIVSSSFLLNFMVKRPLLSCRRKVAVSCFMELGHKCFVEAGSDTAACRASP